MLSAGIRWLHWSHTRKLELVPTRFPLSSSLARIGKAFLLYSILYLQFRFWKITLGYHHTRLRTKSAPNPIVEPNHRATAPDLATPLLFSQARAIMPRAAGHETCATRANSDEREERKRLGMNTSEAHAIGLAVYPVRLVLDGVDDRADLDAIRLREAPRLAHLHREDARRERWAATLLRYQAASTATGLSIAELDWERPDRKKPRLVNLGYTHWDFSLSHQAEWVAVAWCATAPVGVDLSLIGHGGIRAAQYAFSPAELRYWQDLDGQRQARFLAILWALKEAYGKAIGRGVGHYLSTIEFVPEDIDTGQPIRTVSSVAWTFSVEQVTESLILAVASRGRHYLQRMPLWPHLES